jgi:hypothetical protein
MRSVTCDNDVLWQPGLRHRRMAARADVGASFSSDRDRYGVPAHRRVLEQVARLERGDDVPTVPGHLHKAEIDAKLGT